jgi:hypothetical protein
VGRNVLVTGSFIVVVGGTNVMTLKFDAYPIYVFGNGYCLQ